MWPDLAAVKAWLNITGAEDDDFLTHKIAVTIELIESYCNREFELKNRAEAHDLSKCSGTRIGEIVLNASPIVTINTIIGASSWRETGYGTICLQLGCFSESSDGVIIVDYEGGFDPLPAGILDVFYNMMAAAHASKGVVSTGGQIKKETVMGVVSTEYVTDASGDTGGQDPAMPKYYSEILDFYVMGKI